jgi:hypothetical protein
MMLHIMKKSNEQLEDGASISNYGGQDSKNEIAG